MKKTYGLGLYFGIAAAMCGAVGIVGCAMMGLLLETVFLVAGIVLFGVCAKLGNNLLIYGSYGCYLLAGSMFLSDELFTIANEIIAIDANGLQLNFVIAATGIVLTILVSMAGTILPLKRR